MACWNKYLFTRYTDRCIPLYIGNLYHLFETIYQGLLGCTSGAKRTVPGGCLVLQYATVRLISSAAMSAK